jgi:GNAT superfamily N-acetyltransferase
MPDSVRYRMACARDAAVLAQMNQALILDEGHRNRMSPDELEIRMRDWLAGEYEAVLFEIGAEEVGYALYRREPEHVYLRQFFIAHAYRRQGIGRAALAWLRANCWPDALRIRLDVLVGNAKGQSFWRSVGFSDYCLTMELNQ